jgi:16S rRNA (cytosine1402-N4)-methyltransferase
VISFHSGEDRRVKAAFDEGRRAGAYAWVSPEIIRASPAEQRANLRAKPAKLRAAVSA